MVTGKRLVVSGLLIAVMLAGTVSCAAGGGGSSPSESAAAPMASDQRGGRAGSAQQGAAPDTSDTGQTGGADLPPGVQRDRIRTATLDVEVPDLVDAVRRARAAVTTAGGFVAQEQSYRTRSSLALRVPNDALDRVIEDISAYGTVSSRSSETVDVTEQMVDLDARVATQKASVDRVRALLGQATSIGDIVSLESELSRRESDLDSLTRRLTALQDQVALSTLTVDFRSPAAPTPQEEGESGFLDGLGAGWAALTSIGVTVAALIGFLLPFVPVLAVIGAALWWARSRRRARRAAAWPAPAPTPPAPANASVGPNGGSSAPPV